MLRIAFYSWFLLFSPIVFAAKWYQVELIVFEHLQLDNGGELWNSGNFPDYSYAIDIVNADDTQREFRNLLPDSYRLAHTRNALAKSAYYQPLYHTAWQQLALTRSSARKVRIKDLTATIDGTVKLISGRLLYADIDMSYYIAKFFDRDTAFSEQDAQTQDLTLRQDSRYAQIKEIRNIKLEELHYFDHPLFGILIQVTRL